MKNKIVFLCSLSLALLFFSCQDMDLEPKTSISETEYWKTGNDFKLAANKFYNYLESFHGNDYFSVYDLRADLATSFTEFNSVSNGRWLSQENDPVWTDSYAELRQINNLIKHADALKTKDNEILRYKAEALFFRAYINYRLVKRYGDIPLVNRVLDINSPELTMARTPRNEVEDAILKDLNEATTLDPSTSYLPTEEELTPEEKGRITWGAAMAFKARVSLFFGTWGQNHKTRTDYAELLKIAKTSAKEVMTKGKYKLYTDQGIDSYRKLFLEDGDGCNEIILARKYGKGVSPGTTHPNNDNVSAGYLGGVTHKFAAMFLDKNGYPITHAKTCFKGYKTASSEFEDRDPRMESTLQIPGKSYIYASTNGKPSLCTAKFTGISTTRTGYRLWKYISEQGDIFHGLCEYDAKLLRYAEVLLIYAEATYELDGSIKDEDLNISINLIRDRAKMPHLTNDFITKNNLDMKEEIRRERTIELSFESTRYDDLRRWKIAEYEMPENLLGVYWNQDFANANDELKPELENGFIIVEKDRRFNANRDYLAPLPTSQVTMTNNVLKQNPCW